MAMSKERLRLTDEQQSEVRAFLLGSIERRLRTLDEHGLEGNRFQSLSRGGKRSLLKKITKLRKDTRADLSEVLTKDRMTEYKAI